MPKCDVVLMMTPPPCARIPGAKAWHKRKGAVRFIANYAVFLCALKIVKLYFCHAVATGGDIDDTRWRSRFELIQEKMSQEKRCKMIDRQDHVKTIGRLAALRQE